MINKNLLIVVALALASASHATTPTPPGPRVRSQDGNLHLDSAAHGAVVVGGVAVVAELTTLKQSLASSLADSVTRVAEKFDLLQTLLDFGAFVNRPCASSPCSASEVCHDAYGTHSCQYDACLSSPCANGGTCTGAAGTSYTCACLSQYTGADCSGYVPFVMEWTLSSSSSRDISIPLFPSNAYNFTVTWGDGAASEHVTSPLASPLTHQYASTGTYTVSMTGIINGLPLSTLTAAQRNKLTAITQWGSFRMGNAKGKFKNLSFMTLRTTDSPDLRDVTDFDELFRGTSIGSQGNLNNWDITGALSLKSAFYAARLFNQPLDAWDVSKVTTMAQMFYDARLFNQDLSQWNTSSVNDMSQMFQQAYAFNGNISSFDTSKVTNFGSMFSSARKFNGIIGHWDTSNVEQMDYTFNNALEFNQPIGNWNVEQVTTMRQMFYQCPLFNQSLVHWRPVRVETVRQMFDSTGAYSQPMNDWATHECADFSLMFYNSKFNANLTGFDVSRGTNFANMFQDAQMFNQPLSSWNVSAATDLSFMFFRATTFNGDVSTWRTPNVPTAGLRSLFHLAVSFSQSLSSWCVPLVPSLPQDFATDATLLPASRLPVWGTCSSP